MWCLQSSRYSVHSILELRWYLQSISSRPRTYIGVPWPTFIRVADLSICRSLRSVGISRLVVPISILSTFGSRAFTITDPQTHMLQMSCQAPKAIIEMVVCHCCYQGAVVERIVMGGDVSTVTSYVVHCSTVRSVNRCLNWRVLTICSPSTTTYFKTSLIASPHNTVSVVASVVWGSGSTTDAFKLVVSVADWSAATDGVTHSFDRGG